MGVRRSVSENQEKTCENFVKTSKIFNIFLFHSAFTTMPKTAYQGLRESTYRKYVEPFESSSTHKSTLTVLRYARVDEVRAYPFMMNYLI